MTVSTETSRHRLEEFFSIKTIAYRGSIQSEIKTAEIEKQQFIEALNTNPIKAALQQWVALKKGWHPLIIKFHEVTGGSELTAWYPSPDSKKNKNKKILLIKISKLAL